MVIGANIGTTSTAAFAVIGATPNAKRVATAHILFNILTGVLALILLPVMFWLISTTGKMLYLQDTPAVTLAMFHTTFNVLGVLCILPVSNILSKYLEKKFRTAEEIEGKPKYLDKTVAATPALALNAITLELARIGYIARRMAKSALSSETFPGKHLFGEHEAVNNLEQAMDKFIMQLESSTLAQDIVETLPDVLHALQHYTTVSNLALNYARQQADIVLPVDSEAMSAMEQYKAGAATLLSACDPQLSGYSVDETEEKLNELHLMYRNLRDMFLEEGARQYIDIQAMDDILNQINRIDRMTKQAFKGGRILNRLLVHVDFPSVVEMTEETESSEPV